MANLFLSFDSQLVFHFQYSLDNEAERQKYELEAERIRDKMNGQLGTPSEGLEIRNERLNALQRVEAQINEHLRMAENPSTPSRTSGAAPRSANLEQLYHEAIPMDKALSHSGPSAFGNPSGVAGLLQHPVSQFIWTSNPTLSVLCVHQPRRREHQFCVLSWTSNLWP